MATESMHRFITNRINSRSSVPAHSGFFVQLLLVFILSESLSNPLITAQLATGRIRNYQLVVGGLQLLNIPVSYAFLKAGAVPEVTVMVAIAISQICLFARLYMLKGMIGLPVGKFLKNVYLNVIAATVCALVLPFVADGYIPDTFTGFVASVFLCVASAGIAVWFCGFSPSERSGIMDLIKNKMRYDQDNG